MNIHEYQAKKILEEYGAPVSKGIVVFSLNELDELHLKQALKGKR